MRLISIHCSQTLSSWREASPILINRYKLLYSKTASLATSFGGSIGLVIGISFLGLYLEMTIAAYAVIGKYIVSIDRRGIFFSSAFQTQSTLHLCS